MPPIIFQLSALLTVDGVDYGAGVILADIDTDVEGEFEVSVKEKFDVEVWG